MVLRSLIPLGNVNQHQPATPVVTSANSQVGSRKAPIEFNHAINYVNKIKVIVFRKVQTLRFSDTICP